MTIGTPVEITSGDSLLAGLRPDRLSSYLAGLGLIRVLGEQADPNLDARWTEDGLLIHSRVIDVVDWLVTRYRPAPIISPWNGGSGFGAKDKTSRDVLMRLVANSTDRLADLRSAYQLALPLSTTAAVRAWSKERLVAEFRNVCPESLLRWIDATIVLRDQGAVFPPLLGTGGNDGRFDFSTNFHQRLIDVLPELGAKPQRSRGWAQALVGGSTAQPMVTATIGQFDPGAAGGPNSPSGPGASLVNPWEFVLLLEGALYFASGLARRQGSSANRAAMPFCVYSSPDGPTPGAAAEQSRGEVWVPVWRRALRATEVAQLFAESRASWQGEVATQAAHMYAALRSYGVARGIDSFVRFGLHQRNGLAFVAVRLDEVDVRADPNIDLTVAVEQRAQAFQGVQSRSVATIIRRFRRAHLTFVRDPGPTALVDMLAEITLADLAVSRSARSRDELGRQPLPRAAAYSKYLTESLWDSTAFQIAAALAGAATTVDGRRTSVRDLLLGIAPRRSTDAWIDPVIAGFGVRPLTETLAELVRWRSQQEEDPGAERGFVPFPYAAVRVDWPLLHDWVEQPARDVEVNRLFLACLALDWTGGPPLATPPRDAPHRPPNPELAQLQAFASGRLGTGSWEAVAEARAGGASWGAAVSGAGIVRRGLDRSWPTRLLADHTPLGTVAPVFEDVSRRLTQLGWRTAAPLRTDIRPERMVAALVCRSTLTPLRRLGARPPGHADESSTLDIDPDKEGGQ